ncbi:HNH endonuclease family protein [Comamonas sp. 26]|uniref:HNH endonuclease family protein n=1 Tax=Comamonas sp. 26 TaxID=2035201 RepID=UPI00130470EA|nr:HNH endonuclease family protein [Comamonas sp. 26]
MEINKLSPWFEVLAQFGQRKSTYNTYRAALTWWVGDFVPVGLSDLFQEQVAKKLKYPNVHPFVLNYLDYLLWRNSADKAVNFAFSTARRSVEHLHPQNQNISGSAYQWDPSHLHAFGNLCLVTQSMNSKLSDRAEDAKFGELLGSAFPQSLKIHAMHKSYKENNEKWNESTMSKHEQGMLKLLGLKSEEPKK